MRTEPTIEQAITFKAFFDSASDGVKSAFLEMAERKNPSTRDIRDSMCRAVDLMDENELNAFAEILSDLWAN